MIERFLRLVHYNAWANGQVLEQLPALSETYQIRPLLLLSHILRAERIWLGRMGRTPEAGVQLWETDTLDGCRERIKANTADFSRLLSRVDADALENAVAYQNTSGTPYRTPLGEMLEHALNHGTHHRGQIALLIREAGETPPPLDYIVFVRKTLLER